MLSRPDFAHKQIVVIGSEQMRWLAIKNDNLVVYEDKQLVDQLPCSKIFCIFIVWECTVSSKLIARLLKYQISIYLFSRSMYPRCVIGSQLAGNYMLRSKQYALSDEQQFAYAQQIVANKIANQGKLLKRVRDKDASWKESISRLAELYRQVATCEAPDSLRWVEGNASKVFFSTYFETLDWYRRAPRTREDVINLLLDVGYSLIYRLVEAHLNLYGFDLYKGVYHTLFYERKSLVCDLVEPRRCIIDHKIRKMHNLSQINPKDFRKRKGAYEFKNWETRNTYVQRLLRSLIDHKMEMFGYVKSYYQSRIKEEGELPVFYFWTT